MDARTRFAFLLLVLAQAAHAVEETVFKLYDVFAPARLVTSLFSQDPRTGFIIGNVAIVLFGAWCYLARVRPKHPTARAFVWGWVVVETFNGISHPTVALMHREYFPGTVTSPLLLALSIYLWGRLTTR